MSFQHSSSFVILDKIKVEASLWVLAGAKKVGFYHDGRVGFCIVFLYFLVNFSLINR
jgi:hypothetical protein